MTRVLFLVFIFIAAVSYTQETDIKLPENTNKLYKFGLQALLDRDYFLAHKYFERLNEKGFDNDDQLFHYSVLQYKLNDYTNALTGFTNLSNNKYSNQLVNYYLALLYNNMNQQSTAKDYALFFIKQKGNREAYPAEYKHISTLKLYFDSVNYRKDTVTSIATNVEGVNKSGAEFCPLITGEGIMYGSQDMDQVNFYNAKKEKKSKLTATRKIYRAVGKGAKMSNSTLYPIQSDTLELSSFCFGIDKRVMYVTGCSYRDELKKYKCDIYVSRFKEGSWSDLEKIKELSDPIASATHVNMGYDPDKATPVLYYASDKTGGRGGFDLYSAVYNTKTLKFSSPKNLGGKINSIKDDITPFYHTPTNTLYYSSNGRGGLGGHDVFSTHLKAGIYEEIIALDKEVNSAQDDVFFTPDKNEARGYFVSNRYSPNSHINPHCCDDLYYYEKGSRLGKKDEELKVKVIDKKTKEIINEYDYTLNKISESEVSLVEVGKGNENTTIKDIQDSTKYEIEVYNKEYYRKKQYIDLSKSGSDSASMAAKRKKAQELSKTLLQKMEEAKNVELPTASLKQNLDELMKLYRADENDTKFSNIISSLNDIIGRQDILASESDMQRATPEQQKAINQELSQTASQLTDLINLNMVLHPEDARELGDLKYDLDNARKLLMEAEQALAKGDFKTAANKQRLAVEILSKLRDKLSALHEKQEKGRNKEAEKNRISELETAITEELKTAHMNENDKQKIKDLIHTHQELDTLNNSILNPNIHHVEVELEAIDFNPILLPLVEFEFDSFVLTTQARYIIDSLVVPVLEKNPTLKIELSAHTDSRGENEYNESLSQKRAEAIRFFLIDGRGIPKERLVAKGYGEYAPVAPNENPDGTDNPDGRQRNRRCEFRILKELYDPY